MNSLHKTVLLATVILILFLYGIFTTTDIPVKKTKELLIPLDLEYCGYHSTRHILENAYRGWKDTSLYRPEIMDTSVQYGQFKEDIISERKRIVKPLEHENTTLRVAIVCGQHARELISSELCHHLITLLKGTHYHTRLTPLLHKVHEQGIRFWILPIVNEWGREQIEGDPTKACLRVNENAVDLNRNFPCPDYQLGEQTKGSIDWPGPHPLSELESIGTDTFLQMAEPEVLLNIHSGIDRVLLPFDCCPLVQPKSYSKLVRMIQSVKRQTTARTRAAKFEFVNPMEWDAGQGSHLLYTSHGTLVDYALVNRGVDIGATLEIYQNLQDGQQEEGEMTAEQCIQWLNPKAGPEYAEVMEAWILFILQWSLSIEREFSVKQ